MAESIYYLFFKRVFTDLKLKGNLNFSKKKIPKNGAFSADFLSKSRRRGRARSRKRKKSNTVLCAVIPFSRRSPEKLSAVTVESKDDALRYPVLELTLICESFSSSPYSHTFWIWLKFLAILWWDGYAYEISSVLLNWTIYEIIWFRDTLDSISSLTPTGLFTWRSLWCFFFFQLLSTKYWLRSLKY